MGTFLSRGRTGASKPPICQLCRCRGHWTYECRVHSILKLTRSEWTSAFEAHNPKLFAKLSAKATTEADEVNSFYQSHRKKAEKASLKQDDTARCHFCPGDATHWTSGCDIAPIQETGVKTWAQVLQQRNPVFHDKM